MEHTQVHSHTHILTHTHTLTTKINDLVTNFSELLSLEQFRLADEDPK